MDTWPADLDDNQAKRDWGYNPQYDLQSMVKTMYDQIKEQTSIQDNLN